jgi:hypothetical protein
MLLMGVVVRLLVNPDALPFISRIVNSAIRHRAMVFVLWVLGRLVVVGYNILWTHVEVADACNPGDAGVKMCNHLFPSNTSFG